MGCTTGRIHAFAHALLCDPPTHVCRRPGHPASVFSCSRTLLQRCEIYVLTNSPQAPHTQTSPQRCCCCRAGWLAGSGPAHLDSPTSSRKTSTTFKPLAVSQTKTTAAAEYCVSTHMHTNIRMCMCSASTPTSHEVSCAENQQA